MDNRSSSLPTSRFRLPLPNPVNGSFSSFKYNEFPINANPQISQTSSLDVIPSCQQTLNLHPIGKTMPNRRGRKRLATMPLGKKHMQNLNNQRAFRQRKDLETRASELEVLYNSAQDEIKTLRERVAMLEKKLASSRSRSIRNEAAKNANNNPNSHYEGIVNSTMYQAIVDSSHASIYDENKDGACDVIMNGVNQMELNDNIDNPRTSSSSSAIYIRTSTYMSLPITSVCDPITTISDDRIWIASTSPTTTSPLYSTFVSSNPSQNTRDNETSFSSPQNTESQWYFPQAPTTVPSTTHHHPLNLKWILDTPNEE